MNEENNRVHEAVECIKNFSGKKPAVSVSGGKDSLVALDLALKCGVENVVFSNTTLEFEETVNHVKELEKFYGIDIDILKPPQDFFELTKKFGWPSRRWRWCCEVTKFGPLGKYALENKISSFITGLRKEESKRRAKYKKKSRNPLIPISQINPILNWKENHVWDYIKERSLPFNPLYKNGFNRVGCWCCPQKTKSDWEAVENYSPTLMEFLKNSLKESFRQYEGIGITNVDNFVEEMAWTSHVHLQVSQICGNIEKDGDTLLLNLQTRDQILKILKILPMLTDDFKIKGKTILIQHNNKHILRILTEKALNCVGCGACLPTCRNFALFLENDQIKVDSTKCQKCLKCLKTNLLKGACIGRNYGLFRKEIKIVQNNSESQKSAYNGLVRTRIPIDRLKNGNLTSGAQFKKYRGFSEIQITSPESELFENLLSIRKSLLEVSS